MRTAANIAAVGRYGYTDYAGVARVAKNVGLFAAAPLVGLAYAVAFPFVAVGMLAWYGARALVRKTRAA